jgi:hypothetical protein
LLADTELVNVRNSLILTPDENKGESKIKLNI